MRFVFSLYEFLDPEATAAFILHSNFGTIMNVKHRRWARKLLQSLKHTIRQLLHVHYKGYRATTYDPLPKVSTFCTRCATSAVTAKAKPKPKKKKAGNSQMGSYKNGIKVPKKWCDVLCIDADAKNTKWQNAVQKEVVALLLHKYFDFRSPDFYYETDGNLMARG